MARSQFSAAKPFGRLAPRNSAPPFADRGPARRRTIPFRMLADAFGTEDEEPEPEPDDADFALWNRCG